MATFKPIVFTGENHIKSDGTSRINIRVYHNKQSQYIPTESYIKPQYLLKSGEVDEDYPEALDINFALQDMIQEFRKLVIKLGRERLKTMICKELRDYLVLTTNVKDEYIDFVEFSESVINATKKKKTSAWYQDSLSALKWFFKREKIEVREITAGKLNAFITQLREEGPGGKPLEPGSINNYLRGIRALFNKCKRHYNNPDIETEIIAHSPFKLVKIPQYRRKKKNVAIDIVKSIRDIKVETPRENIGRDVFMMQFYLMGINLVDLFNIDPPEDGRVVYERSKTDTEDNINKLTLSIKVEPELQVLFDKYSNESFLSELKNRYSDIEYFNKSSNIGLKKISETLNIPKITTNWSRHSWASIARNKAGASKADVDFCLGHVNNDYKMADIYIETDYSICDKINRDVLDLLK
ncbi:tyrosine-type recombinase/integrase [Mariniphaga sediminis]|uniref:tyrosine-type recombinase/integrase n=1 Tax=Mariniphaga sediminis TaxID=1628158 RepID=UPI00356B5A23